MAKHSKKQSVQLPTSVGAGGIVLGWLTYALWGWCIVALTWLLGFGVGYYVMGPSRYGTDSVVAYAVAAVVVLYVVSLIVDIYYSRVEPLEKKSVLMFVMIIHAVIFALLAIGSLIMAIFALISIMMDTSNQATGSLTLLIVMPIVALLYAALLLRTLRPAILQRATTMYRVIITVAVVLICALGIFGPVVHAQMTKRDKMIESGLPRISSEISQYTRQNNALPKSLSAIRSDVGSTNQARSLIDGNIVEYKPGAKKAAPTTTRRTTSSATYEYQLCVSYDRKADEKSSYGSSYRSYNRRTPNVTDHPAGRVCYDLEATGRADSI